MKTAGRKPAVFCSLCGARTQHRQLFGLKELNTKRSTAALAWNSAAIGLVKTQSRHVH
jgi:hypothetical protein